MRETPPKSPTTTKIVYQNPWITVHEDQTITTDGQPGIYGYLESKDSCMVGVLDDSQRLYLLRAFRYPTKSWGWEFPGGGGEGEDLLDASKRELEEETGILAQSWERLGHTLVCNGLMTERMTTCIAYDISFDGVKESSDEVFSQARFFTVQEIEQMIDSGEINDGQTITAFYLAKRWLAKRKERVIKAKEQKG